MTTPRSSRQYDKGREGQTGERSRSRIRSLFSAAAPRAAMDGFSSAMKLTGLDDFIAPSQACVKPLEAPKPTSKRSIIRFAPALR